MGFYYTNSTNKEIKINDFDLKTEFENSHFSYRDLSFLKDGSVRFQGEKIFISEVKRDKFLAVAEFYNVVDGGKVEPLIFEVSTLSQYINVINFYRFIDTLIKLMDVWSSETELIKEIKGIFYTVLNDLKSKPYRTQILSGDSKYQNLINEIETKVKDSEDLNLKEYLDIINSYKNNPTDVFFRGVSSPIYPEQAAVFRIKDGEPEDKMVKEMIQRHPETFNNHTAIEQLTDMQHYELKTRLLDITTNPLVALYMATNKIYTGDPTQKDSGEIIIYFPQETSILDNSFVMVSYLANLSKIRYEHKKDITKIIQVFKDADQIKYFNEKILSSISPSSYYMGINKATDDLNKLLGSNLITKDQVSSCARLISLVAEEKTNYSSFHFSSLLEPVIVKAGFVNDRVRVQSGGFILFGLDNNYLNKERDFNSSIFSTRTIKALPRIIIKNKASIFKELANVGINDSTMLPDLQHSASYIIDKYK